MRNDFDPNRFGPDDAPDVTLICANCKTTYSQDDTGLGVDSVCPSCEENPRKVTFCVNTSYTNAELIKLGECDLRAYNPND